LGFTNVYCHIGTRRPIETSRVGLVDDFDRVRAMLSGNQRDTSASERRVYDRPAIGLD